MRSASELLIRVGHVEGVEQDNTIRLKAGARLGPLNGRVECQMVDLRAIYNAKFGFDRVALIGFFILVYESCLIQSGARPPIQ